MHCIHLNVWEEHLPRQWLKQKEEKKITPKNLYSQLYLAGDIKIINPINKCFCFAQIYRPLENIIVCVCVCNCGLIFLCFTNFSESVFANTRKVGMFLDINTYWSRENYIKSRSTAFNC